MRVEHRFVTGGHDYQLESKRTHWFVVLWTQIALGRNRIANASFSLITLPLGAAGVCDCEVSQLARHGYDELRPSNGAGPPDLISGPQRRSASRRGRLRPMGIEIGIAQGEPLGIQDTQSLEVETSPTSTWATMKCKI
jgi:hypothetical protein